MKNGTPFTRSTLLLLILVAAAVVQAGVLHGTRTRASKRVAAGTALPSLLLEQRGIPLILDARNLPSCSLLIFLAPSCPVCDRLASEWSRVSATSAHPFLGISYSDWDEAERFASVHSLDFPILVTGSARMGVVASRAGVPSVPRFLVLGGEGRIAAVGDSRDDITDLLSAAGCDFQR